MIGLITGIYAGMLKHYKKKWDAEKIEKNVRSFEDGYSMRKDYGFDERNFERIPKRKTPRKRLRK